MTRVDTHPILCYARCMEKTRERTEYRAIVRRPASCLDSDAARKRGYVLEETAPKCSKAEVLMSDYNLRRSEETWASVHHWQKRIVIVGDWADDGDS